MRTEQDKVSATRFLETRVGPLTFGMFIRIWRERNEWTQVEAAKKLALTKSTLCDFEKGRRLASVEQARRFAKRLGASEKLAVQCCLEDQLRKAKFTPWHVRLVAA